MPTCSDNEWYRTEQWRLSWRLAGRRNLACLSVPTQMGPKPSPSLGAGPVRVSTSGPIRRLGPPGLGFGERQVISQASIDLEVSDVNAASDAASRAGPVAGRFRRAHLHLRRPESGVRLCRSPRPQRPVPQTRSMALRRLGKAVGQTLGQQDVTGEVNRSRGPSQERAQHRGKPA